MTAVRLAVLAASLFLLPTTLWAQPTYKLDVRQGLEPRAVLTLDGLRIVRTAVRDDPGFRLQWHFKMDGKTVATPSARAELEVEVQQLQPGEYSVVLELFHPAYKGGTVQKGEFKPVSNLLLFRLEAPSKPGDPMRPVLLPLP